MASYCEVFERKEKKYRLNAQQHQFMLAALAGRMEIDAFGKTKITSLYYDTPDRRLIARSLEKPIYKEKLRVRCYGEGAGNDSYARLAGSAGACGGSGMWSATSAGSLAGTDAASAADKDSERVFVEVKKKYKGIVYKRRVACSAAAARAYLGGMPYKQACATHPLAGEQGAAESESARSMQISREIDQFRKRYETLRPSMTITCCRAAYVPVDAADEGLRITFDMELAYRDEFAHHAAARLLLAPDESIMEIKNSGPMPLWLSHALAECGAYPSSFSKYGAAYRECMKDAACGCKQAASSCRSFVAHAVGASGTKNAFPDARPRSGRSTRHGRASRPLNRESAIEERVINCA